MFEDFSVARTLFARTPGESLKNAKRGNSKKCQNLPFSTSKNLGLLSLRFRISLGKPQKHKTYKFPKLTEFVLVNFEKSWIIVASLPHQSRKASKTQNV